MSVLHFRGQHLIDQCAVRFALDAGHQGFHDEALFLGGGGGDAKLTEDAVQYGVDLVGVHHFRRELLIHGDAGGILGDHVVPARRSGINGLLALLDFLEDNGVFLFFGQVCALINGLIL